MPPCQRLRPRLTSLAGLAYHSAGWLAGQIQTGIMIEPLFVAAFPVLFIFVLSAGGVVLRRQHLDMDGTPPIDRNLFRLGKLAMVIPWAAMMLQSLGLNLSLISGPQSVLWISLGLWAFGFGLLLAGRFGLGSSFRVGCAKEETTLRVNGIFRYSRNPMYLGMYATLLAPALYTLNPIVFLVGAGVVAVHHRIVLAEEACLRKTFGEEYTDYCRRVRRYL
jgi:protein-S-isoprenylcysteine O-methyltransferase Ste14